VSLYLGRSVHIGGDAIPLAPLGDLLRQIHRKAPELLTASASLAPLARWLTPESGRSVNKTVGSGGLFVPVFDMITHLGLDDAVAVGFEDLHWADAVTWDLFEFVARNLVDERVVLVGTYRANEISTNSSQRRRLAELTRLPAAHRIHLGGLDRENVAERVAALIGVSAPPALIDQILARGEGNPFFTEELVAAHLAGEAIPAVLSDLISADIAGLDAATRQVLGAVATVGRETSHELLTSVADVDGAVLETAARSAIDAQLLVVDSESDAYRFRHALIGEVVYADLLPPQRARLHRRVAAALQGQTIEVLTRADRAGELAFHLDRAGDREAAFVASLAAADAAETVAPAAAFGHLERALKLWESAGERATQARWSDRMWQAAELASGTVGYQRALDMAQAAFRMGPPPQGEAWGHERLGRYLWAAGRLDEGRAEFEQAASLLSASDGPEAARVFAGLGQAELMSGAYDAAKRWCCKVFDLVATPEVNPLAWEMARRVLGVVRSHLDDPKGGVELCRESVAVATSTQARALANLYLCVALLDARRNEEAVNAALDAVAENQLAGLNRSFGGYSDALAAEGLTRLGRWSEAETLLGRHAAYDTLPVGALRVARAGAMLAARQGKSDRARALLADAQAQPVDGFHRDFLDSATADVSLILGDWPAAATAAERGWSSTTAATGRPALLWAARFAMLHDEAAVEQALDALARREPVDPAGVVAHLQERIDFVRAAAAAAAGTGPALVTVAHLAHASASLSRLSQPDPDAWAEAAQGWRDLGDRWATAVARLREADAAAATGAAARASSSLREAHLIAAELGAVPLLGQIDAVSRRTRLSVEAPTRVTLNETSVERLGLTAREAEVLALVAGGRTNRQIGEELFVSNKTASVHVSNILRKLGVTSRADAAAIAQRLGVA
jgi:DNA-binding NarL/FixJ family response regulator